jgi:tRNA(adenine34) deaminase
MAGQRRRKGWISAVGTVSTFPPPGTFTKSAEEIARTMARRDVSPLGLGSAIRMVQYFINRSGRNLTAERRKELERAKRILQGMEKAR